MASMRHIISASRRTDIPAFYSDWFMNRIRAGQVSWANPFNGRRIDTSLMPEDVAAIVFWSKNYAPLLPHLDELDDRGFHAIFHYTITGLPTEFEPNVPDFSETVSSVRLLADRYSPDAIIWRYDPIILSNITPKDYHLPRFRELASALEGSTKQCYFSFPTLYAKTVRSFKRLQQETGIEVRVDISEDEKYEIAEQLSSIASEFAIKMYSCCNESLVRGSILKGTCVDNELLMRLYPDTVSSKSIRKTRKECGCFESKDIGAYDTCPHGCVYCYANCNKKVAEDRFQHHDPSAESLSPIKTMR